jgi:hypothetical protein
VLLRNTERRREGEISNEKHSIVLRTLRFKSRSRRTEKTARLGKQAILVRGQIPNVKTDATETGFKKVYLTKRMTFQVLTAVSL